MPAKVKQSWNVQRNSINFKHVKFKTFVTMHSLQLEL